MNSTIDTVLVPTDGSEGAKAGARRAVDLAATCGARLHALSVIDTREIEPHLSRLESDARNDREQLFEEEAKRAVDEVAQLARTHLSAPVTTAVRRGIPFQSINEYATAHDVDLIAMGTRGRTGLERVLLGSVTEKTLRTAEVPVFTVPPDADIAEIGDVAYENILLPTDGSEGAEAAVDWAVVLAEPLGATVHTVYSADTRRLLAPDGVAEIHDTLEQLGQDALRNVRDRVREAGLSVAGSVASGPPAQVIRSYCVDHDIDLIVMGTHGRSGLQRYLIGSVTETVVRNVNIPVCCVPMVEP